ncbi:MAG: HEAT repeat domain-containing protein [Planctomycetota bacterium]
MQRKYIALIIIVFTLLFGIALMDDFFIEDTRKEAVKMARILCKEPGSQEATAFFSGKRETLMLPALMTIIEDKKEDIEIKSMAITFISALKDKRATELLLELLNDDNQNLRIIVIDALGHIKDRTSTKRLCELWVLETANGKDDSKSIQMSVAVALGRIKDKKTTPSFLETYNSSNKRIKMLSAVALYEISGDDIYLNDIKAFLQDDDPEWRMGTIVMLGSMGNKKSIPLFEDALKDNDYKVRQTAERYINLIKGEGR